MLAGIILVIQYFFKIIERISINSFLMKDSISTSKTCDRANAPAGLRAKLLFADE